MMVLSSHFYSCMHSITCTYVAHFGGTVFLLDCDTSGIRINVDPVSGLVGHCQ